MQTSKVCPWKSTIRVECCDTSWTSNRRSSVFFFDKSDIFENRHGRIFTHVYHLLINYCGAVAYSPPVTIFIVFFLVNFEPHTIPKTAEMFISRVFFYQYNRSNPCRWFSQKKMSKNKSSARIILSVDLTKTTLLSWIRQLALAVPVLLRFEKTTLTLPDSAFSFRKSLNKKIVSLFFRLFSFHSWYALFR